MRAAGSPAALTADRYPSPIRPASASNRSCQGSHIPGPIASDNQCPVEVQVISIIQSMPVRQRSGEEVTSSIKPVGRPAAAGQAKIAGWHIRHPRTLCSAASWATGSAGISLDLDIKKHAEQVDRLVTRGLRPDAPTLAGDFGVS